MTFEEVRKSISSKYDIVEDFGDAWLFTWEGAKDLIGGDQGYVVMKETGERMTLSAYYLRDAVIDLEYEDDLDIKNNEEIQEEVLGKNPKDRFVSDGRGATIRWVPKESD